MEHHKLVLPEHLNDHGSLFGGYLLKWIDEIAYITVRSEFPGNDFVTIALDNVLFRYRIECGQILRFVTERTRLGNTSISYAVSVFASPGEVTDKAVFETTISFVAIDKENGGTKTPVIR